MWRFFKGAARQPHNDECRRRFREAMKDEAKAKNHETRSRGKNPTVTGIEFGEEVMYKIKKTQTLEKSNFEA